MQVCSPAWDEGSEVQGYRGSHRQRAFAKHGYLSSVGRHEVVVKPGISATGSEAGALAVRAAHRYKRGQLHSPL